MLDGGVNGWRLHGEVERAEVLAVNASRESLVVRSHATARAALDIRR
jgi:hypothetical protein